jgi:hypothetical protein
MEVGTILASKVAPVDDNVCFSVIFVKENIPGT